jgi:predicted RNA-binding Zn-ribbon protein involved in translation (DUF1610 family)
VRKHPLHPHLLAPLAWLGLLQHHLRRQRRPTAGQCVYCGYNLAADRRHPNYCPQCGRSQLQEAHTLRRRELMLELERLQLELVRNHQDRITGSNRSRQCFSRS